jgi:hypothetical protein
MLTLTDIGRVDRPERVERTEGPDAAKEGPVGSALTCESKVPASEAIGLDDLPADRNKKTRLARAKAAMLSPGVVKYTSPTVASS